MLENNAEAFALGVYQSMHYMNTCKTVNIDHTVRHLGLSKHCNLTIHFSSLPMNLYN